MRARLGAVIVVITTAGLLTAVTPASVATPPAGPGAVSHFDLARKDCLGTARNTTSKIWYTVAGGVLSDVYAPTIDTTNVETMQYLVTDGSTLHRSADARHDVHGQRRLDRDDLHGHVDREVGQVPADHTYLTDPARASVVVHTEYTPLTAAARAITSTSGSTRRPAATAAAAPATAAPTTRSSTRRPVGGARLLRHGHRDERREPRLRGADLPGAARRPAVPGAAAASSARRATASTQLDASHTR